MIYTLYHLINNKYKLTHKKFIPLPSVVAWHGTRGREAVGTAGARRTARARRVHGGGTAWARRGRGTGAGRAGARARERCGQGEGVGTGCGGEGVRGVGVGACAAGACVGEGGVAVAAGGGCRPSAWGKTVAGRWRWRPGAWGRRHDGGGARGRRHDGRRCESERRRREGEEEGRPGCIFNVFAECPRSGTRQIFFLKLKNILCRVPLIWHSAKKPLPSANRQALDKD
jgi:hypothetical protein